MASVFRSSGPLSVSALRRFVAVIVVIWVTIEATVAQELLDRLVARVDGRAITLSDVRAALGLGIVDVPRGADPAAAAIHQLIERQLVLAEVARFPPPEPPAAALAAEIERIRARVGSPAQIDALMKATGLDEAQIGEVARDTLRIESYLNQRFGASVQVSEEDVSRYYREHPEEFRRNGEMMLFQDAEPLARQRAAAERRAVLIAQWIRDLRQRAEVVELYKRPQGDRDG
jgi:hypothetical protein